MRQRNTGPIDRLFGRVLKNREKVNMNTWRSEVIIDLDKVSVTINKLFEVNKIVC